jgi:predicted nucleic acid-binding protein
LKRLVVDASSVEPLLRDPDDDYLVALARNSAAEAIVSGDKNLLDHPGLEPPAIDARSACRLLGIFD